MRLAVVVVVPAVLLLAGCEPDSVSFQAMNVMAGAGPEGLSLNDEIAIRFNQRLDPTSVFVESLRVTDESGRRLAIRARAAGELLFIAAADPDGWPADSRLAVEVPHPWLGRPIRSAFGAPNEAPFRTSLSTGRRYASRGGSLKLVYHSLPFAGGTDVTEEAEFLFELDGAIDRASLNDGVALYDLTHEESAPNFAAEVVSPRRLSILPFAGQAFRSGTRYRLTLTPALRSEDTRRLGEAVSFMFTTTRSKSGEHTTDFRPEHLVDPSLKPEKGPLTPLLTTEPLLSGSGVAREQSKPFGREPSKVQILIPNEVFGPDPENAIITAMSFRVFGAEPASLRLSARLDYAAPSREESLGSEFEENWNLPATRQRDLIGAEGDIHVLDPADGVITFVFPRPFFYEALGGRARALVLEIVNESGIINDSMGIALRGEGEDARGRLRFVESGSHSFGEGTPQRFVPALSFSIQRARPVLVNPWNTTAVLDPEYFRRQDHIVATPGFVNFVVEYRYLDGVPPLADHEGWRPDLSALDAHRTIQARIRFPLRSADPIPKDAGLLRLTVPFRERGE